MNALRLLVTTMRPAQWVKNGFVAAPVIFAKEHTSQDPTLILHALLAALVFILLAGSVYVMNDILDAEKDRLHPVKKNRPIASGKLPVPTAITGGLLLLASAFGLGHLLGADFNLVATGYLGLNVAYSWHLKNVVWLDVLSIATGFLLRIVAGSFAIGLAPDEISIYLIVCTFLLALYLALGKRRHELTLVGTGETRSVLVHYGRRQLDVAMVVVSLCTAGAYVLYTLSPRTQDYFGTGNLVVSIPFVILGMWRFAVLVRRQGEHRSPTDVLIHDVPFVVNTILWALVVVGVIYG